MGKFAFATTAVVILVLLTMGWRESIVVGMAIIVTLMITLFASWAWGFTLNRVSLFALIFSIGILVDDAIVVVENIHRHMAMGKRKLSELIPMRWMKSADQPFSLLLPLLRPCCRWRLCRV